MNIKGDFGAKKIIKLYKNKTLKVPVFNKGVILDLDTIENFNSLQLCCLDHEGV